ncbi:MAG: helix-turn-helix transcriptional regulator [Desulfobacterales bacterium]|nr:helix-turn-helix transcriptional regulator [Desulfobacterales bacterium]
MKRLFSTKEVAEFLNLNEKMVYALIAEKGLPATKITGKWLFPQHLVEQWLEAHTINYPESSAQLPPYHGLLIIAGSNDLLLERSISLFNTLYADHVAVFGNVGSMGGLRALRQNRCHMVSSHLLQENGIEYNFAFATQELERLPAVVNFCKREQGILVQRGNPKKISGIQDLVRSGIKIVNRPVGTGTRHLFDQELKKAGISNEKIVGYHHELGSHLEVGFEIILGHADAGPGIKSVASLLGLEFISLRWERYDLLVAKERFFDQGIQLFLGMLHDEKFYEISQRLEGYDISLAGKMVFPLEAPVEDKLKS